MEDIYTPTKAMDGTTFTPPHTPTEVYIPTRINPVTGHITPNKLTDIRQKYGAQAGEAYSPSNPGIRIVKRKPKTTTDAEASTSQSSPLGKRSAPEDDLALSALKTEPKKGILRSGPQPEKRQNRRICFADARGFPLTAVKEIEKIASIHHSSSNDFRNFDKNEGFAFGRDSSPEEADWSLLKVPRSKPLRTTMSETGRREEQRIKDLGLFRGAMFGVCSLEDDPTLSELAKTDMTNSKPISIPTIKTIGDNSVIQTLRELPLPGRNRAPDVVRHSPPRPSHSQHNQYEQMPTDNMPTVYQARMATPQKPPVIQQIFNESESTGNNAYYATTEPEKPAAPKPTSAKIELPANLREMLDKLKKKGFVSEDPAPKPASPPLVAAMQTAQQMYQNQQIQQIETESYEPEAVQQQEYHGYIGDVKSLEMTVQETRQNNRNSEGWTQAGWKVKEACTFHINRLQGCNRGDQCGFIHDDEKRQQMLDHNQSRLNNSGRAGFQRDNEDRDRDRGFRTDHGGRRGNFHGGFRGNNTDRDFRDRHGFGSRDRFANHGRSGFEQQAESYATVPRVSQSQLSPKYSQPPPVITNVSYNPQKHGQPAFNGYHAQVPAQAQQQQQRNGGDGMVNKPVRRSRFDQRDDTFPAPSQDLDHRPARRNRFDEGPAPSRPFRQSRFDEGPRDQDDRNSSHSHGQWVQPR